MGKGSLLGWWRRGGAKPLDLAPFRDRVVAEIARRHPDASIERVGEADLVVTKLNAGPWDISLRRTYALYRESPEDLEYWTVRLADVVADEPVTAVPEQLLILVRPGTFVMPADQGGDTQLHRPLAADLLAIVAVDMPEQTSFLPASKLREDLGMSDAEIWSRAVANTRQRLPPVELPEPQSVKLIINEDGHAASALVDDELWNRLDAEAPDGFLVVAAEKNVLCLAAPRNPAALPMINEVLAIAEQSGDYLSSAVLTRRNGAWIEATSFDAAFAPGRFKH